MGWEDAHLHRFVIHGACYGVPEQDERGSRKTRDERKYTLRDVVPREGSQFAYDYDFGDYWQHRGAARERDAQRAIRKVKAHRLKILCLWAILIKNLSRLESRAYTSEAEEVFGQPALADLLERVCAGLGGLSMPELLRTLFL